ncbi:MAG TPA: hypothetical protein VJB97_01210 [Candidatus Paceibacterota bacterium]
MPINEPKWGTFLPLRTWAISNALQLGIRPVVRPKDCKIESTAAVILPDLETYDKYRVGDGVRVVGGLVPWGLDAGEDVLTSDATMMNPSYILFFAEVSLIGKGSRAKCMYVVLSHTADGEWSDSDGIVYPKGTMFVGRHLSSRLERISQAEGLYKSRFAPIAYPLSSIDLTGM